MQVAYHCWIQFPGYYLDDNKYTNDIQYGNKQDTLPQNLVKWPFERCNAFRTLVNYLPGIFFRGY